MPRGIYDRSKARPRGYKKLLEAKAKARKTPSKRARKMQVPNKKRKLSENEKRMMAGMDSVVQKPYEVVPMNDIPYKENSIKVDLINQPPYYTQGKIEVIDFIEDQQLGFHEGNVVKYVSRARHKGNELQDLKKARWYLNRAIANLEK